MKYRNVALFCVFPNLSGKDGLNALKRFFVKGEKFWPKIIFQSTNFLLAKESLHASKTFLPCDKVIVNL